MLILLHATVQSAKSGNLDIASFLVAALQPVMAKVLQN